MYRFNVVTGQSNVRNLSYSLLLQVLLPYNPYVRLLVSRSVGWLVGRTVDFLNEREDKLPISPWPKHCFTKRPIFKAT